MGIVGETSEIMHIKSWQCAWLTGCIQFLSVTVVTETRVEIVEVTVIEVTALAPGYDLKSPIKSFSSWIQVLTVLCLSHPDMVFLTLFGSFKCLPCFPIIISFK